jgi:hypothetical protein
LAWARMSSGVWCTPRRGGPAAPASARSQIIVLWYIVLCSKDSSCTGISAAPPCSFAHRHHTAPHCGHAATPRIWYPKARTVKFSKARKRKHRIGRQSRNVGGRQGLAGVRDQAEGSSTAQTRA